ncbi:N-acetylglucosamine-1-phosphotransferase subunits alpha/beta-like [Tigriopus californicus]|nr:N-acetylglucosamine-1-phosphotransferase subunits alpha/beta-like [Tigriopus californicus]
MMTSGKTLQKRIYTILGDRSILLTLIVVSGLVLVSLFQFGEAWLEWSADKYEAVFNSFSDNLIGKSLQSKLCQYVPVDVVYTWVNGSNPEFLEDLKHAKEVLANSQGRVILRGCPYSNCVPAHILAMEQQIRTGIKVRNLIEDNTFLENLSEVLNHNLVCGKHMENRTLLYFKNAALAISAFNTSRSITVGLKEMPLHKSYWTSEWTVPNSFPMENYVLIERLPNTVTETKLRNVLPNDIDKVVDLLWVYPENGIAVIHSENQTALKLFKESTRTINIGGDAEISIHPAHLIVQLPKYADDETHTPNRFADFEQLRYSLRSLEKYAPWVRQVFLVTNGQIPHWIDMDHPKLTVISHEEIFEDTDILPTFSSPAIEAHLHRIPGLSERFLYMNDDVMLGKEVWPEDFVTDDKGFKIRFSWDLPDCNEGCPSTWINDGYCDFKCNVTECGFDGGDCIGEDIKSGFGHPNGGHFGHWNGNDESACSMDCFEDSLGDGFCDESCNVPDCGFDAGDCGTAHFSYLHKVPYKFDRNIREHSVALPKGTTVAYWDFAELVRISESVMLNSVDNYMPVRSIAFLDEYHSLILVLRENMTSDLLTVEIEAKINQTVINELFFISFDTYGHVRTSGSESGLIGNPPEPDARQNDGQLPKEIEDTLGGQEETELVVDLSDVNADLLDLSDADRAHLKTLQTQLDQEEITQKGFNIKRTALIQPYVRRHLVQGGTLSDVKKSSHANATLDEITVAKEPEDESAWQVLATPDDPVEQNIYGHRQILNSYAASLLTVQKLYSHEYGPKNRRVPSHTPHFIDKSIFSAMTAKFREPWAATARRKFRNENDMQFSFAYFHFLISEMKNFDLQEVFNQFDTDVSGTWSDREIRTLLTRMYNLPLFLDTVRDFEARINDCASQLPASVSKVKMPINDRYYDSHLPAVTFELIANCPSVVEELKLHFANRHLHKHTILEDTDVAFKQLTSNLSDVVKDLDDLRRNQFKFICLNDDMDSNRIEDNAKVQMFLWDFYESILPVPSQFELPMEYQNKFTRLADLREWQWFRTAFKFAAVAIFILLLASMLTNVLNVGFRELLMMPIHKVLPSKPKSTKSTV